MTTKDNWIERFEKEFADLSHTGCENDFPCATVKSDVKKFISDLLDSQLKEVVELVQSNTEGTFTDDGGNDCWYIDKLVEAIKGMGKTDAIDTVNDKYQELIMAVESKHKGETRHETALRYIKMVETGSSDVAGVEKLV